MHLLQETVRR